jgi:hypothetical protein
VQVQSKVKSGSAKYFHQVSSREFNSSLEIPDGRNPSQNAWLTITINYALNFVDSRNPTANVRLKNRKGYIKDSNGDEFELRDWDYASQRDFNARFVKGASFWNYKFLLITPHDYSGLDFESLAGPGWCCRPNVICLFRLGTGNPTHLKIDAVRPAISGWDSFWGKSFRSNAAMYDDEDVKTRTLWHELGHALDQLHIKALEGDAKCMVDINADRCYDSPNIMGYGTKLEPVNAKPWRDLIFHHTEVPQSKWNVTQAVNTPPRAIPLGVSLIGKPARF